MIILEGLLSICFRKNQRMIFFLCSWKEKIKKEENKWKEKIIFFFHFKTICINCKNWMSKIVSFNSESPSTIVFHIRSLKTLSINRAWSREKKFELQCRLEILIINYRRWIAISQTIFCVAFTYFHVCTHIHRYVKIFRVKSKDGIWNCNLWSLLFDSSKKLLILYAFAVVAYNKRKRRYYSDGNKNMFSTL